MNAPRRSLWAAALLFVLSGLTGLVYETVWFKRLGHAWGSSSLAMASVVATFLCGLGLGAWLAGRIALRSRRPLALYGWCELGIAGLALLVPFEFGWLLESAAPLAYGLSDSPFLLVALRFALTFLVIGPPCVLMGATLPLLTQQFAAQGLSLGASAAWLYAFNALGAAAGAWLAGFFLLEHFGLGWTNALAAATNTAIGVAALALARNVEASRSTDVEPAPVAVEEVSPRALNTAALASGLGSITLQMVWARELALLLGGTTYAFSATLSIFILGIGLGSLWFRLGFSERSRLEKLVSLSAALVVLATLGGLALEPLLARAVGYLRDGRAEGTFNALLCASTAAVLQLLPTIGMGLLFPALVQLSRQGAARAGHAVGALYAWNTVGSIAGAACAALLLLPALGSFWTVRAALLAYALLPFVLFRARAFAVATSILCASLLFSDWRRSDPLDTNVGSYMYGPTTPDDVRATMRPVFFEEGANCNVLVLQGEKLVLEGGAKPEEFFNLRSNGKVDASTGEDMPTQLGITWIPQFLRPAARNVLVIGMGSGTTAGASALLPGTQVTVCEIERGVIESTRWFEGVNHKPLERDNVQVVVDDGRSFLQGHPGGWDIIVSEPSNPWIAGIANLFTEEYYRTAQRKLAQGGMLAQWLQTYSFDAEDYALVVRTVQRVFPRCAFLRLGHYDTLILASEAELFPDAAALDRTQRKVDGLPVVLADLERHFGSRDVRSVILQRLWLDEHGLARFTATLGGSAINTDLNMRLEFAAPRRLFSELTDPAERTFRLLMQSADNTLHPTLFARWRCGPEQLAALKELKSSMLRAEAVGPAAAVVALGLAYADDDGELVADRLLLDGSIPPEEFRELVTRLASSAPMEALRLGHQLGELAQHNAARIVFETLTARYPNSATAWHALSLQQRALGDAAADDSLARARELDPIHDRLLELPGDR
ncbi:MAG: hypothetical protein FJ294_00985 [Planctomycetes bacterium]|nr:hypothetical protein [Planctomycetota bacterium]